jgi:transposase-like protein
MIAGRTNLAEGNASRTAASPSPRLRRRVGDKWHLDEVVLKIAGVKHWLWRAVDQAGVVLDVLVQRRRNKQAAERLLRKLLKRQMRPPRVMITDKRASYGAAKREIMPGIEHRQHKGLNNRAENSHHRHADASSAVNIDAICRHLDTQVRKLRNYGC